MTSARLAAKTLRADKSNIISFKFILIEEKPTILTMHRQRRLFILLATLAVGASATERATGSDFVVIANLRSGIGKMSKDEVVDIYMGRNRKLASGFNALPVDLENPLAVKAHFYSVMMKKELSEVSSYWARLVFSGQGSPPKQVKNQEEAIEIVSRKRSAIAYIDRTKLDKRVKVIFDPLG